MPHVAHRIHLVGSFVQEETRDDVLQILNALIKILLSHIVRNGWGFDEICFLLKPNQK